MVRNAHPNPVLFKRACGQKEKSPFFFWQIQKHNQSVFLHRSHSDFRLMLLYPYRLLFPAFLWTCWTSVMLRWLRIWPPRPSTGLSSTNTQLCPPIWASPGRKRPTICRVMWVCLLVASMMQTLQYKFLYAFRNGTGQIWTGWRASAGRLPTHWMSSRQRKLEN